MDICRNVGDNDGLYTGRKGRDVFRKMGEPVTVKFSNLIQGWQKRMISTRR